MIGLSRKDANDLAFLTRDQAIDVIVRLMEERDTCVQALQAALEWGAGMADAPRSSRPKWYGMARAAVAKAEN